MSRRVLTPGDMVVFTLSTPSWAAPFWSSPGKDVFVGYVARHSLGVVISSAVLTSEGTWTYVMSSGLGRLCWVMTERLDWIR